MKLIVGLGNPGRRYEQTRHNVGFIVVAEVARRFGSGAVRSKFQAEVIEGKVDGEAILLACPETFMNLSGVSVQEAYSFYKLRAEDLLVICDDLNLPLGRLRFRTSGSSGGQKGLEDIIRRLGTDQISRLRIGIGQPPPGWDWPNFVLSKFNKDETPLMEEAVRRAAEGVADFVRHGTPYCMNRYNAEPTGA